MRAATHACNSASVSASKNNERFTSLKRQQWSSRHETFHLGIVPCAVQCLRKASLIVQEQLTRPAITREHTILIMMHDHTTPCHMQRHESFYRVLPRFPREFG